MGANSLQCLRRITAFPSGAEYMEQVKVANAKAADAYPCMNFDLFERLSEVADTVTVQAGLWAVRSD